MNGFIKNIISRHINPAVNIRPRLPGKFETSRLDPAISSEVFTDPINTNLPVNTRQQDPGPGKNYIQDQTINKIPQGSSSVNNHNEQPDTQTRSTEQVNKMITIKNARPGNQKTGDDILDKISDPRNERKNNFPGNEQAGDAKNIFLENEIYPSEKNIEKQFPVNEDILKLNPVQHSFIKPGIPAISSPVFSEVLPQQTMPSVIRISIGRIEVKAISAANPAKVTKDTVQKPQMSLDQYLEKRNNPK